MKEKIKKFVQVIKDIITERGKFVDMKLVEELRKKGIELVF